MKLTEANEAAAILRQILPGVRDDEIDIDITASVRLKLWSIEGFFVTVNPRARSGEQITISRTRDDATRCASVEDARNTLATIAGDIRRLLGTP